MVFARVATVVMTRHAIRFGETLHRLININRSEPAKYLFEIHGLYDQGRTVPDQQRMRTRKPGDEQ
jgi:hypothetical protein